MPANPKYLTQNKWQRFAKISAAIIGGFFLSVSIHFAIAIWFTDKKTIWGFYLFSLFVFWCAFMITAFLFKNGWKCWAWYGGVSLLLLGIVCWKM